MFKRTNILKSAKRILPIFFVFFLNSQIVTAATDSLVRASAVADELLRLSGMQAQLQRLPAAVIESFEQSIGSNRLILPFKEADIPELKAALSTVFNSERLQQAVRHQLVNDLSDAQFASLLHFYQSDKGRELAEAEASNSLLRNRDRFHGWYQTHGLRSLDSERQQTIADLERALQATASSVDTLISMQVALQVGLTPALPQQQRQSVGQLISKARSQRAMLMQAYSDSSLEALAFIFQKQSMETLEVFVAFLESTAGQRYVRAVNLGLSRGMLDAAEALGESIRPLLTRRLGREV